MVKDNNVIDILNKIWHNNRNNIESYTPKYPRNRMNDMKRGTLGNKIYDLIFNKDNQSTLQYNSPIRIWDHGIIDNNGNPGEPMTAGLPGKHIYIETTQNNQFVQALGIIIT